MAQAQKGKIKLFCCGGGGINIGTRMERFRGHSEAGFGEIDAVYIDTSRSNLDRTLDPKHTYLIDGLDGSGKIRSENHEQIAHHIRDILQQHKPADLAIVVSTAAGGSGSVIAPSLVSELLQKECPVIVLTIGNADTRLEAENTLKTIKSYEAISRMRKAPVVMGYVQNDDDTPRSKADSIIENTIISLCALFSRENRELDSKDLFNWLRFDRVTSFQPQLAALTVLDANTNTAELGYVASVATLAEESGPTKLYTRSEYQCVGFLPSGADVSVLKTTPVHFVITDGVFTRVAQSLKKLLDEMDESRNARVVKADLLTTDDHPTSSGLVL